MAKQLMEAKGRIAKLEELKRAKELVSRTCQDKTIVPKPVSQVQDRRDGTQEGQRNVQVMTNEVEKEKRHNSTDT